MVDSFLLGATKVVTIHIKGAPSAQAAKTVANSIAQSSLVKTAVFGQDANWGRVLAAVGYLPSSFSFFLFFSILLSYYNLHLLSSVDTVVWMLSQRRYHCGLRKERAIN